MKLTQKDVKKALEEITKRTRELLNSEEVMNEMTFDDRINESIKLTGFEQDIRFLLNELWQGLDKGIMYYEKLLKSDEKTDLQEKLKELKRVKSRRAELEKEGMKAYEMFQEYKKTAKGF